MITVSPSSRKLRSEPSGSGRGRVPRQASSSSEPSESGVGPEMGPEAQRSPTSRLQPLEAWWAGAGRGGRGGPLKHAEGQVLNREGVAGGNVNPGAQGGVGEHGRKEAGKSSGRRGAAGAGKDSRAAQRRPERYKLNAIN